MLGMLLNGLKLLAKGKPLLKGKPEPNPCDATELPPMLYDGIICGAYCWGMVCPYMDMEGIEP